MGKIIIARADDKKQTQSFVLILFVSCLVGGVGGLPIGALLSAAMQVVLRDNSTAVVYGFWALPIIIGMIIVFFYVRKDIDNTDHTVCTKCKQKMLPATEMDTLFYIPAEGDQTFDNPLTYLATNMVRVSRISEIPQNKRGCYVCCYTCPNCANRIVRIADFLPQKCNCIWKKSYYFDFRDFIQIRQRNDLI